MSQTLTQLINRVTIRLSQVNGAGVQIYSEDRIAEMIQHKFDVLFDEAFWPQFSTWQQWTLDGTLGVVTADLTDTLKRLTDIQVLYRSDSSTPIPLLSSTTNPYAFSGLTPLGYEGNTNAAKVFTIWPKTSTGTVTARIRTQPDPFDPDDEVDFDDQALILGATWDYLEDDGTNPNATQKFQALAESRVNQLESALSSAPIALNTFVGITDSFTFQELP